jgi:hypothetical protein
MPASLNPDIRDTNLLNLHPVLRDKVTRIQARLAAEGIPLRLFEGYRTPFRQRMLFDKHDGSTKATAWQSNHNYGMAVDFVFYEPEKVKGGWHWKDKGPYRTWWNRYHAIGRELGLKPLSFEAPHLELVDSDWEDLRAGRYPRGGDMDWADNLTAMIRAWRDSRETRGVKPPPVPRIEVIERPPIHEQPNVGSQEEADAAEVEFVTERAAAEPAAVTAELATTPSEASAVAAVPVAKVTAGSGSWIRTYLTIVSALVGFAKENVANFLGLSREVHLAMLFIGVVIAVTYVYFKNKAETQIRDIASDPRLKDVK